MILSSISLRQFGHTKMHFFISSSMLLQDLEYPPELIPKLFEAGSI